MRGHRFDRILAGSALALVLGVSAPAMSQSVSPEEVARVESRVPVPDTTLLPAPTAADATKPVSVSAAASAEPASTQSIAPASGQPAAVTAAPAAAPTAQPAPVAAEPAAAQPATETAQPAAAPAPEPAAKPVVAAADQEFSDKLRELITGRNADRYFARRNERTGAEAFYKERDYAPLFVANGKRSEAGTRAVSYLERVDEHGMEPSDYQIPSFKEGDLDALAEAELRLAGELLQYVRHASMGRVHYTRVHNDIGFEREAPEPEAILKTIADSKDIKATLDSYQPPHPQYQRLKAKLAEARGKSETPAEELVRIPDGPSMKVNASDPRVPLLRKRLKVAGDETSTVYDQAVVDAVKAYQQGAGLPADGVAGPATFRALNALTKRERNVDIIIANMDRWRWFGRDLGKSYVLLNIPEFRLRLFRDGKLNWDTKVVIGKPEQATPIMTGSMRFITVNPTWNVPPSLIANRYLPALRQDPSTLAQLGLRMEQNRDGTVRMYQPPGDKNALGRIRFNYPNKFLVYQHDTPDKHLFAHDKRAYSHGCMRVENPLLYAEKLLSIVLPNEKYTVDRLRSMYGNSEININFPTAMPVHQSYETAVVDDSGNLKIFADVYGHDARHIAILKSSSERRVADVAQATRPTGTGIPADNLRYQTREAGPFADWFSSRNANAVDRRGNRVVQGRSEPQNFFERLFR